MIKSMPERDFAALDNYQLLPRLLHGVQTTDTRCTLLQHACAAPILPVAEGASREEPQHLTLIEANVLLEQTDAFPFHLSIPLLKPEKMGLLMTKVRQLSARNVPAFALDLTALGDTPPYGTHDWRPRSREDLAELGAAASCPLWLYGVCSPADAEVAMEAGLDALVVHSGAGRLLGAPATIDVFPEILDTVAGMISVYAGGPVRSGIDVFRYLAVGAEAVIVESDRALTSLQAELEYAMRLTGCITLADISYEAIFAPLYGEV
jgi:isopentenyl diphosphate isomerase/L-lactate dehydrogenase-like FMN-dependent dehydrogenase